MVKTPPSIELNLLHTQKSTQCIFKHANFKAQEGKMSETLFVIKKLGWHLEKYFNGPINRKKGVFVVNPEISINKMHASHY